MIFNNPNGMPPYPVLKFTVNGTEYEARAEDVDINNVWRVRHESDRTLIWLRTSGTLVPTLIRHGLETSVFFCAPGEDGTAGRSGAINAEGGSGGSGGSISTSSIVLSRLESYVIVVSNSETSAFDVTKSPGGGSSGGRGAFDSTDDGNIWSSTPGVDGSYAFNDSTVDGVKYGAGGGGGGAGAYLPYEDPSDGGATGGGKGGYGGAHSALIPAQNGTANTGGGGGGGGAGDCVTTPGSGATGIIILSVPTHA